MKFKLLFLLFSIFLISSVSALSLFPNPGISSVSIEYTFNFTSDSACNNVILSNTSIITTNVRGYGFIDINISGIDTIPTYLCEYRDGSLRATHSFSDIIFNTIYARNLNISENIYADGNITGDWGRFINLNVTGTSYLGDLIINADNITTGNIIGIGGNDITLWNGLQFLNNNFNGSGNFTTTGELQSRYLRINSTDGSDQVKIYHDNTNTFMKWNDGAFIFQGDSGTDYGTALKLYPDGEVGPTLLYLYDFDIYDHMVLWEYEHEGFISMFGDHVISLNLQPDGNVPIRMFDKSLEGITQELQMLGRRTGDIQRQLNIGISADADDTASFSNVSYYDFNGTLKATGLNITGTSYLGDLIINADNITVNNILNKSNDKIKIWSSLEIYQDNGTSLQISGTYQGDRYIRLLEDTLTGANLYKGGFLQYDNVNNKFIIGVHDSGDSIIAKDTNAISIARSDGDVDIGTNLDVGGVLNTYGVLSTWGGKILTKSDSNDVGLLIEETGAETEAWALGVNSAGDLQFFDSGTANVKFFLQDETGFAGFNTTSPTHTLNVVGNANITGNLIVGGCIQYNCSDSCITLGSCL